MAEPNCSECPYNRPGQQRIPGRDLDRDRIIVGGAPGREDAIDGELFAGQAGELLDEALRGARVGYTTAIECRTEDTGTSKAFKQAIACCAPRLEDQLEGKDALVLGNEATQAVHGRRKAITKFRGTVTTGDLGTRRATYSVNPSFVLRAGGIGTDPWQMLRSDVESWLGQKQGRPEVEILIDPKRLKLPPKGTTVVVDIETTGLYPDGREHMNWDGVQLPKEVWPNDVGEEPRIRCYGFAWRLPGNLRDPVLGVREVAPDRERAALQVAVFSQATPAVRRLLDGRYPLVAQNHAFEVKWLNEHGPAGKQDIKGWVPSRYEALNWSDTMLTGHALHEDRGSESDTRAGYRLDGLVRDFLPWTFPKEEMLGDYNVLTAPLDVLMPYCGWDCVKELLLHERWEGELREHGPCLEESGVGPQPPRNLGTRSTKGSNDRGVSEAILSRLSHVALPGLRFLDRVESRGMPWCDRAAAQELERVEQTIADCERKLHRRGKINWNSQPQVRTVFRELGLKPSGIRTDGGVHSLDKLARSGLKARNQKWRKLLETYDEYLEAQKLRSMFEGKKGPFKYVKNGRIHPRLSIVGTATGRLSASSPPIHNFHKPLRRCFVAPRGKVFLAADFSGAEVAWAAHCSQDERLLELSRAGRSWHTETSERLDIPRRPAKAVNFGLIYRQGAGGLHAKMQEEHWGEYDLAACQRMIRAGRALHPGFERWATEQQAFAEAHGYVVSDFGWVRHLPGAQGYGTAQAEAKRQAVNTPIQSDASDATMVRAMEIEQEVPEVEIVLLKHDEVLMLAPKRGLKTLARRVKAIMERTEFYWGEITVPLRVEFETGPSWGSMEGMEC